MIRSIFSTKDGTRQTDLTLEQIAAAHQQKEGLLWVSLEQPTEEEMRATLRDIFHFHPLAIEDSQTADYQPPKVDDFGDYLFIITLALKTNETWDELCTSELDVFLGRHYVVTSSHEPSQPAVAGVWRRLTRDERLLERGADFLCHAILDHLVDDYMPVIDHLDEEIERLEDEVIEMPRRQTLERILELKHATLTLRRIIAPQREVMNRLSRDDFPQIAQPNRIYYRDIYDHLVRIMDLSESVRDIITGALDTYLSAASNRLNEIMKALTIVSTIFLPLTFVAGVYGMNFHYMPEIPWRYGYLMVWCIFIVAAALMLWWFRRRGWI
jgi:magnesium transporter